MVESTTESNLKQISKLENTTDDELAEMKERIEKVKS